MEEEDDPKNDFEGFEDGTDFSNTAGNDTLNLTSNEMKQQYGGSGIGSFLS